MIFFSDNKSEIVWDKERGKVLCKFQDGEFKITDARQIEILKSLGYKHNGPKEKIPEVSISSVFGIVPGSFVPAEKIEEKPLPVSKPKKGKKGK